MTTLPPPKSPTVAIARILRGRLGLTQGRDFRVRGEYSNGERLHSYVVTLNGVADATIARHADDIERWSNEGPFPFRVSVRYHGSSPRPHTDIANGGPRVRDTPPDPPTEAPTPTEPAGPAPVEAPGAPAAPDIPSPTTASDALAQARERARQKRRALALEWSAGQAELVAAAGAAQLHVDPDGELRQRARPGLGGQRLAAPRLRPLVEAGLIIVGNPDALGVQRVQVTADGRTALALWRRWRPTPVVKDRRRELGRLPVLMGGEYAQWISRMTAQEDRRRKAEREHFDAALAAQHAWYARETPLRAAWAAVNKILNPIVRRPLGWTPTPDEVTQHELDPAVVEELRADAICPQECPTVPRSQPLRPLQLPRFDPDTNEPEQMALFGALVA
ncbi:hypothetical protein [Embleya sp. AB8]|uniref:hypothetical protein n=1 Tax=Embleya sp. AB8 TaxID=3156304 RepID=UPI003C717EF9